MSKAPPRLDGGLIARKGEAAPTTTAALPMTQPAHAATMAETPAMPTPGTADRPLPRGSVGTIAVTVRLDEDRYKRLKHHSAEHRLTNQQILVEALDAYLTQMAKAAAD